MNDTELKRFLDEYSDHEKEIQRYIGVYLSGLVLVIGWIIANASSTTANLQIKLVGNSGLDIFLALMLCFINAVFIVFLIFKGFLIQEVMQFVIKYTDPESALIKWEEWRRGAWSITAGIRPGYYSLIISIPAIAGISIEFIVGYLLWYGDFKAVKYLKSFLNIAGAIDILLVLLYFCIAFTYFKIQKKTNRQWDQILKEKRAQSPARAQLLE